MGLVVGVRYSTMRWSQMGVAKDAVPRREMYLELCWIFQFCWEEDSTGKIEDHEFSHCSNLKLAAKHFLSVSMVPMNNLTNSPFGKNL